jgi:hypothetical protein
LFAYGLTIFYFILNIKFTGHRLFQVDKKQEAIKVEDKSKVENNEETKLERKIREEKEYNSNSIYTSLPSILENIFYNNFSNKTTNQNGKISNIVSIKDIHFIEPYKVYVELNLLESLFENIHKLADHNWTL